jgi:hypothetical protein
MNKREPKPDEQGSEEHSRFERVLTALFRVDKRDVPKHEPKRRVRVTPDETPLAD